MTPCPTMAPNMTNNILESYFLYVYIMQKILKKFVIYFQISTFKLYNSKEVVQVSYLQYNFAI